MLTRCRRRPAYPNHAAKTPKIRNVGTASTGPITMVHSHGAADFSTAARVDTRVAGAISRHCASTVVAENGAPPDSGPDKSVTRAMTATRRQTAARKRKTAKALGSRDETRLIAPDHIALRTLLVIARRACKKS